MPLNLGQRVQVKEHVGTVKFIGNTEFASGVWVGVELDEEVGRNDGSVEGIRYFELSKHGLYGVFVREMMVNLEEMGKYTPTQQNDILTLHGIIEKLQSKLKLATSDIKEYRDNARNLEESLRNSKTDSMLLESRLEQVSVDKEYLTENNKDLQNSLENIQIKYEELKADFQLLQEEFALNKQIEEEVKASLKDGEFSEENVSVILERNRQLEHALMSLKSLTDLNEINLKNEINSLKNDKGSLEKDETYSAIVKKLNMAENKIVLLQEQLDLALELEKIIDSLHAKNEELTQKVEQLTNTVEELTELHELDKNLEESQMLVEKELNRNIKSLKEIIQKDKDAISDLEKTNKFLESKLSEIKSSAKDVVTTNGEQILKGHIKELTHDLKNMDMNNLNNKIRLKITEQQLKFALSTSLTTNENPNKPIIDIIYDLKKVQSLTLAILDCLDVFKAYNIYPDRIYYTMVYKLQQLNIETRLFISLWEWNYESETFVNSLSSFNSATMDINENLILIENRFKDNIYDRIDIEFVDIFIDHIHMILNINHSFTSPADYHFHLFYYKYLLEMALVSEEMNRNIINDIYDKIIQFTNGKDTPKNFTKLLQDTSQNSIIDICNQLKDKLSKVKTDVGVAYRNSSQFDFEFNTFGIEDILSILDMYYDVETGIIVIESFEENAVQVLLKIKSNIDVYQKLLDSEFTKEGNTNTIIYDIYTEIKANKQESKINSENFNALKDDFENLKLTSFEKDRLISELTINVSLLEKNLGFEHEKNKGYLESIKNELNVIKDEKKLLQEQYLKLSSENNALKSEIQNLIKSSQIFESGHLKKYNDILSEKSHNVNLSLIEEILFLKKVIKVNSNKFNLSDELDWLKEPLIPNLEISVNYKSLNFHNLSNNLRQLCCNATIFNSVVEDQKWKAKHTSHKHKIASLYENISRYTSVKEAILSSSLL